MNNNKYNVYTKHRKSASNEAASFKIAHLLYSIPETSIILDILFSFNSPFLISHDIDQ